MYGTCSGFPTTAVAGLAKRSWPHGGTALATNPSRRRSGYFSWSHQTSHACLKIVGVDGEPRADCDRKPSSQMDREKDPDKRSDALDLEEHVVAPRARSTLCFRDLEDGIGELEPDVAIVRVKRPSAHRAERAGLLVRRHEPSIDSVGHMGVSVWPHCRSIRIRRRCPSRFEYRPLTSSTGPSCEPRSDARVALKHRTSG